MWGEGTVLAGRYQLRQRIGGGSMGDVWRALDTVLGREVAVKILLPALLDDAGFAARFQTEARVLAALSHPGIVSVFDYGEADDPPTAFLVMELITGRPLSDLLDDSAPLSEATTLTIVAQTLEALQAAHDRGIVHRDVKPANLMLRGGSVVVTDFGVARTADARRLTAADVVLGTAVYAAPEQARHTAVTAAADQYAVGVIAYECLTGAPPFDGGTPLGIMMKHLQEPVPPLPDTVSAPVRALVMRALAKDPAERFASAREMAETARRLAALSASSTRIGLPQDSFQTGVDVAAVEAAAAGASGGGAAAGPRPDGDFLSFVVVPRTDGGLDDGDLEEIDRPVQAVRAARAADEGVSSSEAVDVDGESGESEIPPAWASYAVRPSSAEGADWASFTVQGIPEPPPVEAVAEAEEEEDDVEDVPSTLPDMSRRVVPQDSFMVGLSDEVVDEPAPAPAPVAPKTPKPPKAPKAPKPPKEPKALKPPKPSKAVEPEVVTAEAAKPHIAAGHAMPLDSFTAGVELDSVEPHADAAESAPEPSPHQPRRGRRGAIALATVGVAVVVAIAVAYPLSHGGSSAPVVAAVTQGMSATASSATASSATASSATTSSTTTSNPASAPSTPSLASVPPPPVSSSSATVPHKSGSITNVGDGDAIDVYDTSAGAPIYSDGAQLTVEPAAAGRAGQSFQATALSVGGHAAYTFAVGFDTNQVLDAGGGAGKVALAHCACGTPTPAPNQAWWLSQDSSTPGGAFYINSQGVASQCLTDNGPSIALSLKPCVAGNKAQEWYLP